MNTLAAVLQTLSRGLFLDVEAYDELAEDDNPLVEGLFLLMVIGLAVAVANVVGAVLGWATTPDLTQVREIIYDALTRMPWFELMRSDPAAFESFNKIYGWVWDIMRYLNPGPLLSLAGLILRPLLLIVSWLWFALLAQGTSRLLGGNGSLKGLLGAAALASAPNLLHVLNAIPTVVVAAVGTWVLLARYVAVRRVHENLSWGRALAATLVPYVLAWLLFVIGWIALFLVAFGLLVAGGVS
ncbi:MAG: hypothetical protein D6791_03795 [Chloroflexi bacterium]|nr:MAG: hypothetical protein D6791_03795 [Chloroflexota bacterium]